MERQYTKQEIIALYLNQVDFVNGAVGIRSAAKIYMNKEPKDLTIEESALFVGMLKILRYIILIVKKAQN